MTNPAINRIRSDHRSLAAILHGMRFLVNDTATHRTAPNFPVLRSMVYYIDRFSEQLHHPKEDRHLFPAVRARTHQADEILARLERDHAAGAGLIRDLEQSLIRYEEGGKAEFEQFRQAVESYAEFHWSHMRCEEDVLLPLAREVLTEADWSEIAAVFEADADPMFGAAQEREMEKVFTHIVSIAPPPIGVGPESPHT